MQAIHIPPAPFRVPPMEAFMREDTITTGPRLLDAIKDLCRVMGYSRAWSLVRNDTAAAPIYDWLLSAEVLIDLLGEDPRPHDLRPHWSELVSLSRAALRIFGPGTVDHRHEGWIPVQQIRRSLAELGEVVI